VCGSCGFSGLEPCGSPCAKCFSAYATAANQMHNWWT